MDRFDYKLFYDVYDQIIRAHDERVLSLKISYLTTFHSHMLKEHRTVSINLGRKTGKSSYILNSCADNDLIIVPNRPIAKDTLRILDDKKKRTTVLSSHFVLLSEKTFKETVFNTVWIDEPSMCFKGAESLDNFYTTMAFSGCSRIVMFGR